MNIGRFELHLAVVGDANVDVRASRPTVGINFSVRLRSHGEEDLGLSVELFQVQPDRAVEIKQIGPIASPAV